MRTSVINGPLSGHLSMFELDPSGANLPVLKSADISGTEQDGVGHYGVTFLFFLLLFSSL